MKMKTSELSSVVLNWVVAKCEARRNNMSSELTALDLIAIWDFSADWSYGGPIIEQERIQITPGYPHDEYKWVAIKYDHIFDKDKDAFQGGDTPLIAAMRCYVASKLGDEVELPWEAGQVNSL